MKTHRIDLEHQRNENHFQLQKDFYELVVKFTPLKLDIDVQFAAYLPLYLKEESALDLILKSPLTQQIADKDIERDHLVRGFYDAVKSSLNHFNAGKRDAAHRLETILEHYGNITNRTLDNETAAINDLIKELMAPANLSSVNALGLSEWISAMDAKNIEFVELMKQRYTETSTRTDARMLSARAEVDKAFRGILDRLDALMMINGEAKYIAFVKELNSRIDRYKDILNQQKGRRDAKASANGELKVENETAN